MLNTILQATSLINSANNVELLYVPTLRSFKRATVILRASYIFTVLLLHTILVKIKINILMNNFRRSHRPKNERSSLAVECDPQDIAKMDAEGNSTQLNVKYPTSRASKPMPVITTKGDKYMGKNIQDPEKQDKNEAQNSKFKPFRARKNQLSKTMKLQSTSINFDANVYSFAINDTDNREAYLSTLYNEVETLRDRIQLLEGDQSAAHYKRTLNYDGESPTCMENNCSQDRSRTIQARRSMCGRLYSKGQGLNSERRSSVYSDKEPQSTWRHQGKKMPVSEFDTYSKEANDFSEIQKEPAKSAVRPVSNYRVKQNSKRYGDKINQQVGKFRPAGRSASIRKIQQSAREQIKKETPEQLKAVFVENPQWEITGINDDFRTKIMKKLQIPAGFPINIPQATDKLEEYYQTSREIYAVFNVDIQKCRQKLVVRRFKNGVYFQLKPNKNIVWYFHGTFYFGQWQTDLPSEGDKNGFGFEYVPKKYFYLGKFKDGMRHGKGTIKIINVNEPNPDCFMCYDGEWAKGKPSGFGKQIDQKDNKYMGDFVNGEKTGNAIILNRDGLYYQGKVKNGLKHGYGVQKLVNGDTYMGQFVDGKFEGHGIYKWKNGSMYEGEFLRGKREGRGKWKSFNGDEFDGDYVNDIKHGWGKFTWANGEMYEGEFRNDIRHGPGTYKHPSGKMGKFMWIDGQIDHRLYSRQEQEYRCRNIRKQGKQ